MQDELGFREVLSDVYDARPPNGGLATTLQGQKFASLRTGLVRPGCAKREFTLLPNAAQLRSQGRTQLMLRTCRS
jgi:hypothetical protein